ncbi:hypothetical protein B0H67DRAFT_480886, partial [Lasiosphaeris hirsuta]
GTSVKTYRNDTAFHQSGILQFEYCWTSGTAADGFYWGLSELDGIKPNVTGSPFWVYNVEGENPHGVGVGSRTCNSIRCLRGLVCKDSYQHPDDTDSSLTATGMWMGLCLSDERFWARGY